MIIRCNHKLHDIPRKIFKIKHSQKNAGWDTQALPRIFGVFEYSPPPPTPPQKKNILYSSYLNQATPKKSGIANVNPPRYLQICKCYLIHDSIHWGHWIKILPLYFYVCINEVEFKENQIKSVRLSASSNNEHCQNFLEEMQYLFPLLRPQRNS